MPTLLHPDRVREGFRDALGRARGAWPDDAREHGAWAIGGWRIDGERLVADAGAVPPGVIAVPCEDVLLLLADLPLPSRRRKLAALPFAIEDRIADPLDAVHVALGEAVAPDQHVVAIVRHAALRRWLALAAAAGLERAALVPDALLLPRPAAGRWAVALDDASLDDMMPGDARAIVRTDDGAGFAVPCAQLGAAWAAGGRPPLVVHRGLLPEDMAGAVSATEIAALPSHAVPLDLRQGGYAPRARPLPVAARRILGVLAAGCVAHGAIAAADTLALRGIAARRGLETQALAAALMPDATGEDAAAPLSGVRMMRPPSRLLPLLARVSAASGAVGPVAWRALSYDEPSGTLVLDVDPGAERALAGRLAAAGLAPAAAPGRLVVRADGG